MGRVFFEIFHACPVFCIAEESMSEHTSIDVLVVGSGPAGLSCAIEAVRAGLSTVVLEKGGFADALRRFPTNLVWFSTPELLEIGDIPFVISTTRPSRVDTLNYYQKVAQHYALDVRTFEEAIEIRPRESSLHVLTQSGSTYNARTVIVATGYFDRPNHLDVPGEDLPHVAHYYVEPYECFGENVVVVGGRNSAVEAALDLYRHGVKVTLVHRGPGLSDGVKYWILPDIQNRIKAGQIRAYFDSVVESIGQEEIVLRSFGERIAIPARFAFILIGFSPDIERLKSYGVHVDPETLGPCISETTFETNVRGLFVAGSIVAGKNNNKIFVENGRLHAKSIIPEIARRLKAR